MKRALHCLIAVSVVLAPPANVGGVAQTQFHLQEATIVGIHKAFGSGQLTCAQLTRFYLDRIEAYNLKGPALHAIITVNPKAVETAAAMDRQYAANPSAVGTLHCVPIVLKDNFNTSDMPTTGGNLSMKTSQPAEDAFTVAKLRRAGALIIGKANLQEFARGGMSISSLGGQVLNPYDLTRTPGGSSGGTGASVAANLALAGTGSDTGQSIRSPASANSLDGIRPTRGLVSRAGVIPNSQTQDEVGPIARTVTDAALMLDVMAGYDPADPVTFEAQGRGWKSYTPFLDPQGLRNSRIGVFRRYTDAPTADAEVKSVFENALRDLAAGGAVLVDPFEIPDFEALTKNIWCDVFRRDVDAWLAGQGGRAPYPNLKSIFEAGLYVPGNKNRIGRALAADASAESCRDIFQEPQNIAFREAVLKAMDAARVDALVYPTWSNPPRKIGDFESPAGDNSQLIPPHTGFPGISVPMGYTRGHLPAGLQIVGRLFGEPVVIKIAFAYEQATRRRRPPAAFK